jgi:hypothetical protein
MKNPKGGGGGGGGLGEIEKNSKEGYTKLIVF